MTSPCRIIFAAAVASAFALAVRCEQAHSAADLAEADDQYAVAAGHYAQQRWKLAAEEFRTFVTKYPQHPKHLPGLFYLGEALVQSGQYEEALQRFQQYMERAPGGEFARQAVFRIGEAAYLANKRPEAKAALQQFLQKYPEDGLNAYTLPYLGEIALEEKDWAGAERYFRQGLARFPDGRLQDDCRFGLARALEKLEKYPEAEKLYLALSAKPAGGLAEQAQWRVGAVQYALGKYAEAAESFAQLEQKWPHSSRQAAARLGRGWALLKLNRPAEAAACFQKITGDAQLGIEASYWLGLAQKAQKDWFAAAKTLLEAAATRPNDPLVPALRFHAGDALLHAGDHAAAKEQFAWVLQSAPADNEWLDDAMLGLAQVALRQKDHAAVERLANDLLRRFPASAHGTEVVRLFVRSLLERKEYQLAAERIEPRLAAGAGKEASHEDRYLLALAYEGLHRYEDAWKLLQAVIASADEPLKSDALLAQASIRIAQKRFAEAIAPLEAYLASRPSGDAAIRAQANLAICYARTGRLDQAKKLDAELMEKHPTHEAIGAATEQLAEAAYESGEANWAAELFGRLAQRPSSPEKHVAGLSGLGWSQFKAGKLPEAAAALEQLLSKYPDAPLAAEAALVRGQILEQLRQADAALAMYDTLIQRYPKAKELPQALLAAARLRHKLHQDRQAAALFERLVQEYPQLPEIDAVLYEWGWALSDLGKTLEAASVFERLRRDHPHSPFWADATFRLAQRALADKNYAQARELADALSSRILERPLRENVLVLRGQIAAGQAQWQEARGLFEAALKLAPTGSVRVIAEYGLAETMFRLGEYEAAQVRFERLAREAQDYDKTVAALALLRQAQALCHQKKWTEAYQIASQIETKFPGFEEQYEADYLIGRCLASRADFEGAREAYRRVIRSSGGAKTETAANAQLMIGETYFHQKDYETALREYLRAEILYAYPAVQAAALLQAGKCHELLGEWKQAEQLYARLLKLHPGTLAAKEAAERQKLIQEQKTGSQTASGP